MRPRIEALRRRSERAMPDTVIVVVPGELVSDGRGHWIPGPPTELQTSGRLSGLSASEEVTASRLASTYTAKVSVPTDTDVSSSDSLTVAGVEYNITGVMPASDAHQPHKDVLVAKSS